MVLADETVVLRMGGGNRGTLSMKGGISDGSVSPGNFGTSTPCMVIDVDGASSRNISLTA